MSAYYGTLTQANDYFASQLDAAYWEQNNTIRKERALRQAKRIIDRLPYFGEPVGEDAFPRGDQIEVPAQVREAQYEIAYALLSGLDPEAVINAGVHRIESIAGATVTKSGTLPHFANGVPSATAWDLLQPYMDNRNILRATYLNEDYVDA
jgi:hypothetical protein